MDKVLLPFALEAVGWAAADVVEELNDPPPGITAEMSFVEEDVIRIDEEGTAWVMIDPWLYFKSEFEYGNDPLDILMTIKNAAGADITKAVLALVESEVVAIIGPNGADSWPRELDL